MDSRERMGEKEKLSIQAKHQLKISRFEHLHRQNPFSSPELSHLTTKTPTAAATMLLQLPRLTSSLRDPFDTDHAYLRRKSVLQAALKPQSSARSLDESELARTIAYKQFVAAVVELIDDEVDSDEFREVALTAYRLSSGDGRDEDISRTRIAENKAELQRVVGRSISDVGLQKVISVTRNLVCLQPQDHLVSIAPSDQSVSCGSKDVEFGAELDFKPPFRFLVDIPVEDESLGVESTIPSISLQNGWHDAEAVHRNVAPGNGYDLKCLRKVCEQIVKKSSSELLGDDLAMAICRVLNSDKHGEEIAADLMDLVGYASFETVQDLISVESSQSMIQIVGLSATLPNYLEVQFLRVNPDNGLFFFDSSYCPVPLVQQYIKISEKN
ncbi:DExH-box ATP-dependent RNA helicase DExH14-like protein [Drosera capensis]